MASLSYWFLSPSLLLAMVGKLRGWDRTTPTPDFDWTKAVVDVVLPAKNEEQSIALALSSLARQNFPIREILVFDDGSTDRTSAVVRRYSEIAGRPVKLIARAVSVGKTPALREYCEASNADAMVILDGDTVMVSPDYISRLIQELFRNAGVAAACGEVMPLTPRRRAQMAADDPVVERIHAEFALPSRGPESVWARFLAWLTVVYRTPMYLLLQRTLYDGNLKLFGAQLNPVGCAVAYKTERLRECFAYAQPRIGDNLSMSEDIYIGHYFNWKGWRSVQVLGVRCESNEPPIHRLPRQLFVWSSAFLQSSYYFLDLPLSPLKRMAGVFRRSKRGAPQDGRNRRRILEQYRAAWGEHITRRDGRPIGWFELISLLEKTCYPLLLAYFALFDPDVFWLTVVAETALCMALVLATGDRGSRLKSAMMLVPAFPIRLMSLGVDAIAVLGYLTDLATGNRKWRK